jgi:hypothetical protein
MRWGVPLSLPFAVLALVATACCGDDSREEPDYSKAGSTGTVPEIESRERGGEYAVEARIPEVPVCDVPYEISVRVRQQAVCATYDYRPLYDRAAAIAGRRIAEVACPAECRPRHSWLMDRTWDCVELSPGVSVAAVTLKYGVLCPRTTQPLPTGIAEPAAGPIRDRQTAMGPVLGDHEQITEEVGGFLDVPCGQSDLYEFNYYEKTPDCATLASFRPAVQAAEKRARFMYDQIACQTGCTKDPFRVSRTEWSCEDGIVKVRIYFVVTCKQS